MFYAARAALSEEDRHAKIHKGTWALFRELFVESGRFDAILFQRAQSAQQLRLAADYDARLVTREEAEEVVEAADRFVDAVCGLLGAAPT